MTLSTEFFPRLRNFVHGRGQTLSAQPAHESIVSTRLAGSVFGNWTRRRSDLQTLRNLTPRQREDIGVSLIDL